MLVVFLWAKSFFRGENLCIWLSCFSLFFAFPCITCLYIYTKITYKYNPPKGDHASKKKTTSRSFIVTVKWNNQRVGKRNNHTRGHQGHEAPQLFPKKPILAKSWGASCPWCPLPVLFLSLHVKSEGSLLPLVPTYTSLLEPPVSPPCSCISEPLQMWAESS